MNMAERVGFEPTVRFPVRSLSRRVLSTAQSPLRGWKLYFSRDAAGEAMPRSLQITTNEYGLPERLSGGRRRKIGEGN
jgi:hypothetical protein